MPKEGYYSKKVGDRGGLGPCWLAASPDKKWIYISGLGNRRRVRRGYQQSGGWAYAVKNRKDVARHVVCRVPYGLNGKMEVFAGVDGKPGSGAKQLKFPEGLACDAKGRVYVADTKNNRIQVFDPSGKAIKSLKVPEPYAVTVHPKSGAIYVLSYPVKLQYFKLLKFKSIDQGKVVAEQKFKAKGLGLEFLPTFCLDHHAKTSTIWLVNAV